MPLRPVRDLLYLLPLAETSEIGLIIKPDQEVKRRMSQGIVKYRGPWTTGDIRRGDHVLFSSYVGDEIALEGEGLLKFLPEEAIDAIWVDGDNVMLTIEQVKLAVERACAETCRTTNDLMEREAIVKVTDRMLDHLSTRFFEEMFF